MPTIFYDVSLFNAALDTEVFDVGFSGVEPGTASDPIALAVANNDTVNAITEMTLNCRMADGLPRAKSDPAEDTDNEMGREIVEETMLEASTDSGSTWVPLDENANYISLGAIAAGGSASFWVRLNMPADAESINDVHFELVFRAY